MSRQEDIVIFDRLNCSTFMIDPYYQFFPCETVYATVEVKSILDHKAIPDCIEHTDQLRGLDRGCLGPISGLVFAYDSYDSKRNAPAIWAKEKLIKAASESTGKASLPKLVFCLKKDFVVGFTGNGDEYEALKIDSGTLALFFSLLLQEISRVQTRAPQVFWRYVWSVAGPKLYSMYSRPPRRTKHRT